VSRTAILAKIKTAMQTVSGIGTVHDRERYSNAWGDYLSLFQDSNKKINGATISRRNTVTQQVRTGQKDRCHIFVIRMIYGVQDSANSEAAFQAMVDKAIEAFDADETLGGTCNTINLDWGPMAGAVGLQVDVVEIRKFGTVMCHVMEGRLCAEEYVSA